MHKSTNNFSFPTPVGPIMRIFFGVTSLARSSSCIRRQRSSMQSRLHVWRLLVQQCVDQFEQQCRREIIHDSWSAHQW